MKKPIYGAKKETGPANGCVYTVPATLNINSYMNRAISSIAMITDKPTKDFALQRIDLIKDDIRRALGLPGET